jgi:uncharacterized membrane protein YqhA
MCPVTGEPAEQSEPVNGEGLPALQRGFERGLALSRLLVLIPVIFLKLDAAASFVYGADILIRTLTEVIGEPVHVGARLGRFLVVMDTFLVGVTLMILAFGFYELFVITKEREGHKYWLPGWLKMHDIEDLKARVVSMLILVAAITFVDRLVESQVANEVLFLGAGIALVILGLTAFLWFTKSRPEGGKARHVPPVAGASGGPTGRDDVPAPAVPPAGTAPGRKSARQHRRVTAILGSTMREGRWQAAEETVVTAIAGLVRLDLRDAELPGSGDAPSRQIRIKATSGLGVVSIIVPPEMEVAESGTTVLGIRSVCTRQASAAAGRAAVLVLSGSSVLGVVRVRRRSG